MMDVPAWILVGLGGLLLMVVALLVRGQRELALERGRRAAAELARETALRDAATQRRFIDLFADGLTVGIIICNLRAVVTYANREAITIFGGEMVGKPLLSATLSPELEAMVKESGETDATIEQEVSLIAPGERIVLAKSWRAEEARGQTFLSLIEITHLRRLERVRRDFVANVSHELRTPLTIIRAYAESLIEDDADELRDRYLPKIISEVDRLAAMSRDLLVLTASESAPALRIPCDLAEIVAEVSAQLAPQAAERGLTIRCDCAPSLSIEANPEQMTQVILNLIGNAITYSNEGEEITVTLRQLEHAAFLTVEDRGLGIASEHLGRIFERFYRVDRARSRATGGTGLGLAIVRHIVEAHGGRIEVESALNVGTTFRVTLPLSEPPLEQPPASPATRPPSD